MSVASLPSEFLRTRSLVRDSERRPKPSGPRPFATGAERALAAANGSGTTREDFMWQLVASLSDLRGYARRLTGDASDAGDLVQETCRRAIESRELFIAGSDIRAWLCCIVRNLYRDRLRRLSREVLVADYEQAPAWAPERRPSWALVSDDDLDLALASLQPQYHQTYVLYAVGGQSYQEIARRLHVSSSTVGTRILRARLLLREFLEKRIDAQNGEASARSSA